MENTLVVQLHDKAVQLLNHLEEVLDEKNFEQIDHNLWNAVSMFLVNQPEEPALEYEITLKREQRGVNQYMLAAWIKSIGVKTFQEVIAQCLIKGETWRPTLGSVNIKTNPYCNIVYPQRIIPMSTFTCTWPELKQVAADFVRAAPTASQEELHAGHDCFIMHYLGMASSSQLENHQAVCLVSVVGKQYDKALLNLVTAG